MRIVKIGIGFLMILIVAFSCMHNKVAQQAMDKNAEFSVVNLIGVYKGNLPCADCDAIETFLTLTNQYDFEMKYRYIGKSDQLFEYEGKWHLEDNRLVLEGVDYMYKVDKNRLWQLDLSGNEIMGELADKYVLVKSGVK